jgi:AcrR family transcriptional regulator
MGTREDAREGREEALLNAAAAVFRRDGFSGATVRTITEAAGCATGTFYLYFPSKDDCFQALIDRLYHLVLARVVEARNGASTTLDKLWRSIAAAVRVLADEPDLAHVVLVQGPGVGPAFRERLSRVRHTFAELIADDLIESGVDTWEAAVAARALTGALGEVLIWQVEQGGGPDDLEKVGEEVRRLFWRGLGFGAADGVRQDGRRMREDGRDGRDV